ncbi:MAG TPA: hypothetical protein VHB21_25380 [Minicystis sp.]|nr:hypothetical protein [Minicystis sp.]
MFTQYRDPRQAARLRLEELLDALARERPARLVVARIGAARVARVAFGAVGIAGALLVVVAAALGYGSDGSGLLSKLLLGSWTAAVLVWVVARTVGMIRARRAVVAFSPTNDPSRDVAALEARPSPAASTRLAFASIALPLAAISLLAPLTLHLAFWALVLREPSDGLATFDPWIVWCFVLAGHAHVVLAAEACRYARRLTSAPLGEVDVVDGGWRALGVTVFASAFPGVVLFFVPPVLTAATGVAFVPAVFVATQRLVATERRALAAAGLA